MTETTTLSISSRDIAQEIFNKCFCLDVEVKEETFVNRVSQCIEGTTFLKGEEITLQYIVQLVADCERHHDSIIDEYIKANS